MARVGRLAGGLLLETTLAGDPAWFLIGDTKLPCDWLAAGFEPPEPRDVVRERFVQLQVRGAPALLGTSLSVALEGVEAAHALGERLTVSRNGSVSERLWNLIIGEDEAEQPSGRTIPCAWLCETPSAVWDVVREAVLKCS
jgi:hypothetical protein